MPEVLATPLSSALADAVATLEAVAREVRRQARGLAVSQWSELVASVEQVGRLADTIRIEALAPVAPVEGDQGAVPAHVVETGACTAPAAIAQLSGISERTARRRLQLAAAVVSQIAVSGAEVPPRYPTLAAALQQGLIGVDSADLIAHNLDRVRSRASASDLGAAESGLVEIASDPTAGVAPAPTDDVADAVSHWCAAIDQDGARPREQRMMRRRSLRFGREDADGLIPIHGRLALTVGQQLRSLVEAHRRLARADDVDTAVTGDEPSFGDSDVAAGSTLTVDDRTPDHQRHDALAAIVSAAARAVDAPTLGGSPIGVIVTVTATDLNRPDARAGDSIGRIDGSSALLSRASVESLIDRGGLQAIALSDAGAVIGIGSPQRCFTPRQRRALIARDGGCVIPGCRIPAAWCEVHHVVPWRDGGATHTDNGALLCWWHHSRIDTGPWRLRMIDGLPHVRGPGHPAWVRRPRNVRVSDRDPAHSRGKPARYDTATAG